MVRKILLNKLIEMARRRVHNVLKPFLMLTSNSSSTKPGWVVFIVLKP